MKYFNVLVMHISQMIIKGIIWGIVLCFGTNVQAFGLSSIDRSVSVVELSRAMTAFRLNQKSLSYKGNMVLYLYYLLPSVMNEHE